MARISLMIDENLLPPHTREQFQEWVEFCVGHRAEIQESNPLSDRDMEAHVRDIDFNY